MRIVKLLACLALLFVAVISCAQTLTLSGHTSNRFSPDPSFDQHWTDPKATDDLDTFYLKPVSFTTKQPGSFDMSNFRSKSVITINGTGSIRFDFGQTNAAWLEFDADNVPDSVSLSISEYNEPAVENAGALNRIKTMAPVKHGHTYRLELNPELYEGVRFGWVHIITHKARWQMKNLRLVCEMKPVNYQGSFTCSDTMLNRIWYTGAYTVKLNLRKRDIGAILMERSDRFSWTGDAYPSQAAAMVAFGNFDMVRANLINTSTQDNGIASYALYWVLSLVDYVNYSGDKAFALQYLDNACKKLDVAYRNFDGKPNLGFYGWDERLGAGFENGSNPETYRAYRMLSIHCWNTFAQFARQLGKTELYDKYNTYAQEKFAQLTKDTDWTKTYGIHAAADAINTGLTAVKDGQSLYRQDFTDRVNRLSYSPFNQYFIIQSLAGINKYNDALSMIDDCWGGQIRYGGTTFFEVYRPSWNRILGRNGQPVNNQCGYTSLTHPWSAGVVKWLSEETLGIKPLSLGFDDFEIVPHLGSTLTWVKGATPTAHGIIKAEFNTKSGLSSVTIPEGSYASLVAIPVAGSVKEAYMNGSLIYSISTLYQNVSLSYNYLQVNNLSAGKYNFRIIYKQYRPQPKPRQLPWKYAISEFRQDSLTHEHWKNHYGRDGYTLFNALDTGHNMEKLPAYVSGVKLRMQANVNIQPGKMGAITTQDPNACLETMTIDVKVTDNEQHQLAIYFLDWNNGNRRSAVEIFDLNTLNLLAPVQMVKSYTGGKYLIFKYRGSISLRVDQVRGTNAAISGLFFDGVKVK